MKHSKIAAVILSVGMVLSAGSAPAPSRPATDLGHEIFHAVLEGLYQDGLANGTVDLVLKQDEGGAYLHFIRGCPICMYVLEAFRHYRARPDFVSFKGGGNTWGDGLPAAERKRFASTELKTRLEALHDLVERWLARRMDRLRLDADERADWRKQLEERSEKGMAVLKLEREAGGMQAWGDLRCPSCDGAVDGAGG